tara:strand:- start:136 stop:366 length:231 start_codon:yes stop_codon:yes gene_type:complete
MTESLFKLKVNKEYLPLLNDLIKYPLILFITNTLMFITDNRKSLLSRNFSKIFIFLILGICFYHLILDKIVKLEEN